LGCGEERIGRKNINATNMYLHELKLWNFRKYGMTGGNTFESSEPGLKVQFRNGVNVLIGENDSGKTTIVDAIRYVLRTQSLEYIQIEEKDFHQNISGDRSTEMKIECTFKGFTDAEAGHFLEWIGFETKEDNTNEFILKVWLYARTKDNSIYQYVRAGVDTEGNYIEGEARDLLRVVYLKPLRDALSEMTHGNKSRLAQILKSHSVFRKTKNADGKEIPHDLKNKYDKLKKEVDDFFAIDDEK
jgi:putative ATP-dependent endonuclease of OLD family